MSLNDPLANALSHILIEDRKGKRAVTLDNNSKTIRSVLEILKDKSYLGEYEVKENNKGGEITVNLLGAINKTGVIKPRYSVTLKDYDRYVSRYLPAAGFGLLIVSTNKGIMTHEEAIEKKLGGRLLAYVY